MSSEELKSRVRKIIAEQLGQYEADVTDDKTLAELGADSLDQVELVMALEDEFGVELEVEVAEKILTVQGAIDTMTAATAS